ncbi:uncharacterized protein LOC110852561 [Folsomia candida]|nr:uncharacterized protein LOC110852561 [Folsomia candida]
MGILSTKRTTMEPCRFRNTILICFLVVMVILNVFVVSGEISEHEGQGKILTRNYRGLLDLLKGKKGTAPTDDNCNCVMTDQPVCGNNRVTYANPCSFKCAMQKNSKLRVVRQGAC